MSAEPTTPTREHKEKTDSEEEVDTFEDAPDMTPRPKARSPSATRSLTRRSSSASQSKKDKADSPIAEITDIGPVKQDSTGVENNIDGTIEKNPTSLKPERMSFTSMDDINLGQDSQNNSHSRTPTQASVSVLPPKHKTTDSNVSNVSLYPNGAPPTPTAREKSPSPSAVPSVARKFNSPFSWLSRATTAGDKKAQSPPPLASPPIGANGRRNTNSSVNSHVDLMVNKFSKDGADNGEANIRNSKGSLKDRFKLLRMREETGTASFSDEAVIDGAPTNGVFAGLISRSASIGYGLASPTLLSPQEEKGETHTIPSGPRASPGNTPTGRQATINLNLAPGTAAGMASGPPGPADAPVDWDLWQSVVYEGPAAVARTSPEELNAAIANGIPQAIRGVVWQVLAKSKNEELEEVYRELVVKGTDKERGLTNGHLSLASVNSGDKHSLASSASSIHSEHSTPATTAGAVSPQPSSNEDTPEDVSKFQNGLSKIATSKEETLRIQKLEKVIKRDLGARTSYSKYVMAAGLQDGLFGVCKAYALYDEGVGYAQGMNFIAMPLLFNMPEEEAFCMLVRLMSKYGLRELFIEEMPGLHLHLYQFERLLEEFEPALYCHLHRRGVNPNLYATQWFLTLFAYRFPLQLVLRIYDLILSEGLEGAILKFGIVLMQRNKEPLLGMKDMSQLTTYLKDKLFDVYIDKSPSANSLLDSGFFGSSAGIDKEVYRADMLVQDACAIKITPDMLKQYTVEWEEKVRAEKEREAELETLRSQNTSLAQKVRRLEEQAEKSDTEHVQMASELVRTKVENETVQDENESLRGQVDELREVVRRQTEEVESRLKGEMDSVMARNVEVHNLNRALEEEKQEMEQQLVATKMDYAQINSEYESIKQKWNNIQSLLNAQ
ncbi:RabGAP/TBC [Tothia fuscella]|uniref:GTPase-activating protein GYP5 n=1 Tax=Tothia fuscella TaxID=1048955 RepID=A0A9P4TU81_9PEZI|nr:RabGAP/TBC [Tothia fuscella]